MIDSRMYTLPAVPSSHLKKETKSIAYRADTVYKEAMRTTACFLWMVVLAGCSKPTPPPAAPAPPIKAIATVEEVMHGMVIPSAQVVWGASGTIYTKEGVEERQPKTENDWINVEAACTTLTEAGNLLMMEGRAKDHGKWMERAKALREAGDALHKAAKAKDVAALFERGGNLFDACQGCHFDYRFTKDPNTIRTH